MPLDGLVARLSRDRVSLPVVLAGLPVISLTTTGRRSGLPRRTRLIAIPVDETLALLGTNFGRRTTPAWTLNLRANPVATIDHEGTTATVTASPATSEERAAILAAAAARFAGTVSFEERLRDKRPVDVFVLRG